MNKKYLFEMFKPIFFYDSEGSNHGILARMATWVGTWVRYEYQRSPGTKSTSRKSEFHKKTGIEQKNEKMPSTLRVGSEVSSMCSRTARLIDAPANKRRRVRERVYGIIMRSLTGGKWEVKWAAGEVEEMSPGNLKREGDPTPQTMELVRNHHARR